ncbi:MAG: hypothetical protein ABIE23_04380 [archaeon]
MNKIKEKTVTLLIAVLYILLFLIFSSSYFHDDLAFDFAGYAIRYQNAFTGWFENIYLGLPASTYDPFLPALLPKTFAFLGFGSFTLPLTLSIFSFFILVPLCFVLVGKEFNFSRENSLLFGLIFVLNPITFKFLNRYYELAAWFFFLLAFVFFYKFIKEKNFPKKYLVFSVLFACLTALSHLAPFFFLCLGTVFLIKNRLELKKIIFFFASVFSLMAFWFIPYFYYLPLSSSSVLQGTSLITRGILFSTYFLVIVLLLLFFLFYSLRKKYASNYRLILFSFLLSLLLVCFPSLPILSAPFYHSYHVFFIFVILFSLMPLLKEKPLSKKHLIVIALVILVCGFVAFEEIQRQYFFKEPRFSDSPYGFGAFGFSDFSEIDLLLKEIPANNRFEVIPYDPLISAHATAKYDLSSLNGWGYNPYALKKSKKIAEEMISMQLNCSEFSKGIEETFTIYWISMDSTGFNYLSECGLSETAGKEPITLFKYDKEVSFIENGELIDRSNNYIKFETGEGSVKVKESYFPRWNAYSGEEELNVLEKDGIMELRVNEPKIIELKYESTEIDYLGVVISFIALISLAIVLSKKNMPPHF